jgi:hypothetical protein
MRAKGAPCAPKPYMTKRKLTKEHLEKLKKGREKRNEESGLVCKFGGKVEIWCDNRQFILKVAGRPDTYFPCLELVLDDICELKLREISSKQNQKDISGLFAALKEHREWFEKEVKRVLKENLKGRLRPKS